MKFNNKKGRLTPEQSAKFNHYQIIRRLDESLPLATEDWKTVEHMLIRLTEFAPPEMLIELTNAIASFADDQAKRAYILGQEDLCCDRTHKVA